MLLKDHNAVTSVRLEPATLRSRVKHSTTEPLRSLQSVKFLAADTCLTADPGVTSSIPAPSRTFVEIDHEIISTVILLLLIQEGLDTLKKFPEKFILKRNQQTSKQA